MLQRTSTRLAVDRFPVRVQRNEWVIRFYQMDIILIESKAIKFLMMNAAGVSLWMMSLKR